MNGVELDELHQVQALSPFPPEMWDVIAQSW